MGHISQDRIATLFAAASAGKFLRFDSTGGIVIADGVNTNIPIVMAANAGAFTVEDSGDYSVEVSGALTAQGALTATFSVPVDAAKITFNNTTTGGFALVLNGVYTIPQGITSWYWNGASLIQASSDGFRTADVTPLPTPVAITSYSKNHLVGANPDMAFLELRNLTAEKGYGVGTTIRCSSYLLAGVVYPLNVVLTGGIAAFIFPANATFAIQDFTTGAYVAPTPANWSWRFFLYP